LIGGLEEKPIGIGWRSLRIVSIPVLARHLDCRGGEIHSRQFESQRDRIALLGKGLQYQCSWKNTNADERLVGTIGEGHCAVLESTVVVVAFADGVVFVMEIFVITDVVVVVVVVVIADFVDFGRDESFGYSFTDVVSSSSSVARRTEFIAVGEARWVASSSA